ncbi:hypothetical protein HDU86_001658 [Geranomyces michiganensis]|nr:hypothetical protein HDU86_001658 [Geranomyces michiganensis]
MDLAHITNTTIATTMSSAHLEPVSGSESGRATPDTAAPRAAPGDEEAAEAGAGQEDMPERSTSASPPPPPPPSTANDPQAPRAGVEMMDVDGEEIKSVAEAPMESGAGRPTEGENENGASGVAESAAGTPAVSMKDDPMDEDAPIGGGGESRESSLPPAGDGAGVSQRQFRPIDVSRENFAGVYANFLKLFHFQNPAARHCRLTEHLAKFDTPPKNQKRTFDTYDFYEVVKDIGGVEKVSSEFEKMAMSLLEYAAAANKSPGDISQIKSWSEVARRLGFDPRGTNIAARVKDWMVYHHIGAYFDFLLGISNEFFMHARGELDESDILAAITGVTKRQDQESTRGEDQTEQQQHQLLSAKRRAKTSLVGVPSSRRRTTIGSAASSVQGDSNARWRATGTASDLEEYGTPNSSLERGGGASGSGGLSKATHSYLHDSRRERKSRKGSRSRSVSSSGTASSRSRSSSRSASGGRGRRTEAHSYRADHPPQHQQQHMHHHHQQQFYGRSSRGGPMYGQNGGAGMHPSPDYHLPSPHQHSQHPGVHHHQQQQRPINDGGYHPHSHPHPHHHSQHHQPSPQRDVSQQQQSQHPLHLRGYPYPLEHPVAPYSSPVEHARMPVPSSSVGGTPYNASSGSNNTNSQHYPHYQQVQPVGPPSRGWGPGGAGYPATGMPAGSGAGGNSGGRATPTLQLPASAASSVRGASPAMMDQRQQQQQQQAGEGTSAPLAATSPPPPPAAPPSSLLSSRPASRLASPVVLPAPAPTTTTATTTLDPEHASAGVTITDPITSQSARSNTTTTAVAVGGGGGGGGGGGDDDRDRDHPLTTHLSTLTHLLSAQPSVQHLQREQADLRARCYTLEDRAQRSDARCRELAELLRASNEMVRGMQAELADMRVAVERAARVREVVRGLLEELPGGGVVGASGGPASGGPAVGKGMHMGPR